MNHEQLDRVPFIYREGGYRARTVPRSHSTLTGLLPTLKDTLRKAFEAPLERDFLTLLEFDRNVETFFDQPVRILYTAQDGKTHRYTPDVLVFYRKDCSPSYRTKPLLAEIKTQEDLARKGNTYSERFAAADTYAKARGWDFRVLTELEIRTPYLTNARFLLPYRRYPKVQSRRRLVQAAMEHLDEITPALLLETAARIREREPNTSESEGTVGQEAKGALLVALWQLVDEGAIFADLQRPLTMTSPIGLSRRSDLPPREDA